MLYARRGAEHRGAHGGFSGLAPLTRSVSFPELVRSLTRNGVWLEKSEAEALFEGLQLSQGLSSGNVLYVLDVLKKRCEGRALAAFTGSETSRPSWRREAKSEAARGRGDLRVETE